MQRTTLSRLVLGALILAAFVAPSLQAQDIPAGNDFWTTRPTGNTYFTFPEGDVESLCGLGPDPSWDHVVGLTGVPVFADADTIVGRMANANLTSSLTAVVPVQVRALHFKGLRTTSTPCGELAWEVTLSRTRTQPISQMEITRTNKKGGFFQARIAVEVDFIAYDANSGAMLGSLPYGFTLPDPGGMIWTYGGVGGWRPGVSASNDCFAAARAKVANNCPPYCDPAAHEYYISQYQAQGVCPPDPR